jgi:hypothetical protein
MAIAKRGPMYLQDLRAATGAPKAKIEDEGEAPFGRGNVVQTWATEHGYAVDFHHTYPLRLPLRKLLLKMEQSYPLPAHRSMPRPPAPQSVGPWRGDKLALFGGAIATNILLSIGALGWTFEALCVSLCTGYDRVVVKKSLRRLEKCGILHGDRQRKPGFNFGKLDGTLYRHIRSLWESFANFRRDVGLAPITKNTRTVASDELRDWCVNRYLRWSGLWGCNPSSDQLIKEDPQLVRCIYVQWGGFPQFYSDLGFSPLGKRRSARLTTDEKKADCRREYRELSERLGRPALPKDMHLHTVGLYKRIRNLWSGLPAFRKELWHTAQPIDLRRRHSGLAR